MNTDQAELAATVHFSAKLLEQEQKARPTEAEVMAATLKWKQDRVPPFEKAEVAKAVRNLSMRGWLKVKPSNSLPSATKALLGF
jgi:hypothetical protein